MIISINKNTMILGKKFNPSEGEKQEFLLSLLIHSSYIENVSIQKTARRLTRIFIDMDISTKNISSKIYTALKTIRDNKLMSYAYEVMYHVNNFIKLARYTVQDRLSFGRSRAYKEPSYSNRFTSPTRDVSTMSKPYGESILVPNDISATITTDISPKNGVDFDIPAIPKPKMTMNNSAMALFSNLNAKKKK